MYCALNVSQCLRNYIYVLCGLNASREVLFLIQGQSYKNCRRMAIDTLVQQLCREEEVGFVDLWGFFVGRADMFMRDGLHLSGKGAAVFAYELLRTVNCGMGSIKNIFGNKRCLN